MAYHHQLRPVDLTLDLASELQQEHDELKDVTLDIDLRESRSNSTSEIDTVKVKQGILKRPDRSGDRSTDNVISRSNESDRRNVNVIGQFKSNGTLPENSHEWSAIFTVVPSWEIFDVEVKDMDGDGFLCEC